MAESPPPSIPTPSPPTEAPTAASSAAPSRSSRWRGRIISVLLLAALAVGVYFALPVIRLSFVTESTDDAYVNGHATFVAGRVAGQVAEVLVDDNMRVRKGDLLVRLDREPYEVQLAIAEAAVKAAEASLDGAQAQVRGEVALIRANRFGLERAVEEVNTQVARLKAAVAELHSQQASLDLARANLQRGEQLLPGGGISKEEVDARRRAVQVSEAAVEQASESVAAVRVGLGLAASPDNPADLASPPADLIQNHSTVRQALSSLVQSVTTIGYKPSTWDVTPQQAIDEFYSLDPEGNLERIYAKLIPNAPQIKIAQARLLQAERDREQAKLQLRYCDIVAEIDGVVTRRTVNSGNNIQAGQALMVIRSLTDIWVDANFKETQLADLRIGQRAVCRIDMYGKRRELEGRVTGFTMGTGQTLSLLPPQNATGNFVKIVQRLPVRIELTDHDHDELPLFFGLSVFVRVFTEEPPTGPHAGEVLQPHKTAARPAAPDG